VTRDPASGPYAIIRAVAVPSHPIGIDDLNVFGSTLAIDFAAIASARGHSAQDLAATGFERRSVTPPYEDPVTLGVNAAQPLVERAGRDAFGLLIVATETGVDFGKPLSTYVHQHLRLHSHCRNIEVKHACYGGTAAVQLASAWVRSAGPRARKALVVMTDLARRHCGDPAELTAGSGALAVTIAAEPNVLEIDLESGSASREIYDVARPTATTEWGDAVLSLAAYLDLLEEAWFDYRRATVGRSLDQQFDYVLYHTPLVSLTRQAHRLLLEADHAEVTSTFAAESFDRMVRPALGVARELANTYSASVYTMLAGLIAAAPAMLGGARVAVCSYGSGSCAEIYGGRVSDAASATLARNAIAAHLGERVAVDVELYERLVSETDRMLAAQHYEPPRDFVAGHFERCYADRARLVLQRIENYHRCYEWTTG
jgi:3-hydroxy-3-methylglutaryl CoA synthase